MNSDGVVVTLPSGEPHVLYTPHEKQRIAHAMTTPNLIAIGSRGSGKSLWLRFDAHMRALSVPNCNLVLVRRTFSELAKTHLIYIDREMKLLGGHYHATDHIAYYPNGSRLFFSYVGSEGDALNLLSAEFLGGYFDELSTIPWEFFMKLQASIRVPKDSGLTAVVRAATNPLGPSASEIRQYFVDKSVDPEENPDYFPDDWGYVRIDMEDNPFLDQTQYRKRFAGMPDHIRKAWLEGEFADEYALFDFRPTKRDAYGESQPWHVIKYLDEDVIRKGTIYRAFDMGYSPDPAYCLWIAHLGNRYVAFHEQVWYKTVVADIAVDMKAKEAELRGDDHNKGPLYGKLIANTFADPTIDIKTGADIRTIKDQFEMHGVPMECSVNNREHYASAVHSALAEEALPGIPRLQIYDGGKRAGCPYLIKTIPMMQFDPKHPNKMANHKHDHAVVTLAYFLISFSAAESVGGPGGPGLRPWQKEKAQTRWVLGKESVR